MTLAGPFPDARHLSQTVNMPPVVWMILPIQLLGTRELTLPHADLGF